MTFSRLKKAGFELEFTSHAEAILKHDFPELSGEIETALLDLSLPISEIIGGGGGEAKMTQRLRRKLAKNSPNYWPPDELARSASKWRDSVPLSLALRACELAVADLTGVPAAGALA